VKLAGMDLGVKNGLEETLAGADRT
jgi:hypothetical protein